MNSEDRTSPPVVNWLLLVFSRSYGWWLSSTGVKRSANDSRSGYESNRCPCWSLLPTYQQPIDNANQPIDHCWLLLLIVKPTFLDNDNQPTLIFEPTYQQQFHNQPIENNARYWLLLPTNTPIIVAYSCHIIPGYDCCQPIAYCCLQTVGSYCYWSLS